jgi:Undecaprenyl-phosphate glucose phosphotransferase
MAIGYSRYLNTIYGVVDILLLNFSFAFISIWKQGLPAFPDDGFILQFVYINFLWFILMFIFRITEFERVVPYERVLSTLIKTVIIHFLLLISVNYFIEGHFPVITHFFKKYFLFIMLLITWRSIMWGLLSFFRKRGLNYRKVILLGGGELSLDMKEFFRNHPEVGYRLEGIFLDNQNADLNGEIKGRIADSKHFALKHEIDEIYCSLSDVTADQVRDMMQFADSNLIRFKLIPDFRGFQYKHVNIDFYQSIPVISVRKEPLQSLANRTLKRLFDIIFSLFVLIFIFPWLFPLVAMAIKLTSKGPVFFKQMRSGKNNKEFICLKFRTMVVNKESHEVQATKGDSRITKAGRFLRKTSIDELPQFLNVLVGHMSVVGPRPHMLKHTEEYSSLIDKFMVRHFIKPGITGWAQVNGLRGETRDPKLMEKRVEFDVWYIENWSMLLDLKIIILTIQNMLKGDENAS